MRGCCRIKIRKRTKKPSRKRKVDDDSVDLYQELDSYIDGILRTEDGNKFKIKKEVLAENCPFFKALYSGNFEDGKDVLLKGIYSETLKSILDYLYTGVIELTKENAVDIMVASDYLLMDTLLQKSRSYILTTMTTNNFIPLFLKAWRIERLNILKNCYRFILLHFEEVVSQSEDIGNLPLEALKKLLTEKSLNVYNERTAWNAIAKWIELDLPDRLQFVPELLNCLSLKDVDDKLMKDIFLKYLSLIQQHKFCRRVIVNDLQETEAFQNFRQMLISQGSMTESRIPTNPHLIIYNCTTDKVFNKHIYLTFDGEIDYWQKVGSVHFFPDILIQLDHYVYMFDTTINISMVFNFFYNKCQPMTPIFEPRSHYSVVSVNGFIYIMGGKKNNYQSEDIERFDPKTSMWQKVSRMAPMLLSETVALNGYIYAIGYTGWFKNRNMVVQVYDPESDSWSSISAPKCSKPQITAVACRGRLYIIGWETVDFVERSVEEYDPVQDVWTSLPDLPLIYHTPRVVAVKDVLIVYEKHLVYGSCVEKTPPVYWIPQNRTWNIIDESSPLRMIRLFRFCSITGANLTKLLAQRNRKPSKKWVKSPFAYLDFQNLNEILVPLSEK